MAGAAALLSAQHAFAAQPHDWDIRFQKPATAIMSQIEWFADYTMWFVIPICVLVLALLAICIVRFRASANPVPSRTSHNTLIEVIWTVGPVVILLFIAVPSFQLLTAQYSPPSEPALTVKVTGHQWYWSYDYQNNKKVSFDSLAPAEGRPQGRRQGRIWPSFRACSPSTTRWSCRSARSCACW